MGPGWIPWRGLIGSTFSRIGTIGLSGELRPKSVMTQNPICPRVGPYEGSERDSMLEGGKKEKMGQAIFSH